MENLQAVYSMTHQTSCSLRNFQKNSWEKKNLVSSQNSIYCGCCLKKTTLHINKYIKDKVDEK